MMLQIGQPPRKVWTRDEANLLNELGFPNVERLELIEGDLIDQMGKKRPHALWQTLVRNWCEKVFAPERVQSGNPINVAAEDNRTSEPQPDVMVTRKSVREYSENPDASDILLLIEIADSTLAFDLGVKAALYARAGIEDYWVVNVPLKQVVVHRDPANGAYSSIEIFASNEAISPLANADARFRLDEI